MEFFDQKFQNPSQEQRNTCNNMWKFNWGNFIGTTILLIILIIGAWLTLSKIENNLRNDVGKSLQTIRDTTQEALHL